MSNTFYIEENCEKESPVAHVYPPFSGKGDNTQRGLQRRLKTDTIPHKNRKENNMRTLINFIKSIAIVSLVFAQNYQQDNFVLKFHQGQTITFQLGDDNRYEYGIVELDALNDQYDVLRLEKMFVDEVDNELSHFYRVWFNSSRSDIDRISNSYQSLSSVEFVELQSDMELLSQNHPNDPLYNFSINSGSGTQEQWYLYNDNDMNNNGQVDGTNRADIYAPEAWAIQTGRADVILSFSDSGIEWDHDDLKDNIWINVEEDANGNGQFDNFPIANGGDFGDANSDGCPGGCGVDDDGDGYIDFNDPGVISIYTNGLDDDGDGYIDEDSPGQVGYDDDGDGVIDDYDGAIYDDDENGYVDDVIGFDFRHWDSEPEPDQNYNHRGHGTAIAGDMAAVTNNGVGVSGVAWGCKIMTTKIFGQGGNWRSDEALYYSAKNGAQVHNMSWLGPVSNATLSDVYFNKNMLLVGSAGNSNLSYAFYPSSNTNVISVAGIGSYDQKSSNSNYGSTVELSAAYSPITIVWLNNTYAFFGSGTSHSSPIVAGVAGLIISEFLDAGYSNYTVQNVRDILDGTADNIDYANQGLAWEGLMGHGRVNAYNALNLIVSPPLTPTGFTVSGNTGDSPLCSWSANSEPDLDGYKLYKNEANSGWALFRTFDKSITSYTDYSVIIGAGGKFSDNVCYKVSATDLTGNESSPTFQRCKPLGSVSRQVNLTSMDEFFPFEMGNTWQYLRYRVESSDTTISLFSIIDAYEEDGQSFFTFDSFPGLDSMRTVRLDTSTGEIFLDDDCLWLNPHLSVGDTLLDDSCFNHIQYFESIESGYYFDQNGEIRNYHQSDMLMGYHNFQLFEGMGPIQVETNDGFTTSLNYELVAAEINGVIYGEFVHVEGEGILSQSFKLETPYPNPFNPTTMIQYMLESNGTAKIQIFDVNGRLIETLVDGIIQAGTHDIQWNAGQQPSGVYFVKLTHGNKIKTQKIMLLK